MYNIYGDIMSNKIIAITDVQKSKMDLLKNAYIYKTKKHIKWVPFIDVVLGIVEVEIKKMPDFVDPVIKEDTLESEGVIEVPEEQDPNYSD